MISSNSVCNPAVRSKDEKMEKICSDYMVKNFWDKRGMNYKTYEIVPHGDIRNKQGIDVLVNGKIGIDEKVKYYGCINTDLAYPSVEILTADFGHDRKGWFIAPDNQTTLYAFISIFASTDDYRQVTLDNIDHLTYLLVSKAEIKESLGNSYSGLWNAALDCKYNHTPDYTGRARVNYGKYHLTYTDRLREKPVNLVFKRSDFLKLPHTVEFKVYRDHIDRTPSMIEK
jgi:hypothetical protein